MTFENRTAGVVFCFDFVLFVAKDEYDSVLWLELGSCSCRSAVAPRARAAHRNGAFLFVMFLPNRNGATRCGSKYLYIGELLLVNSVIWLS